MGSGNKHETIDFRRMSPRPTGGNRLGSPERVFYVAIAFDQNLQVLTNQ